MITANPAYMSHDEKNRGTLTAGKIADFVVLSESPLVAEDIESIEVKALYLQGKKYISEIPKRIRERKTARDDLARYFKVGAICIAFKDAGIHKELSKAVSKNGYCESGYVLIAAKADSQKSIYSAKRSSKKSPKKN